MVRVGNIHAWIFEDEIVNQFTTKLQIILRRANKNEGYGPETWSFENLSHFEYCGPPSVFPVPSIGGGDWRFALYLKREGKPGSALYIFIPRLAGDAPLILTVGVADQEKEWIQDILNDLIRRLDLWTI